MKDRITKYQKVDHTGPRRPREAKSNQNLLKWKNEVKFRFVENVTLAVERTVWWGGAESFLI